MPLLISWSLVGVWLGLFVGPATARRLPACGDPGSICAELDAASAVFVGTVVNLSVEDTEIRPVRLQTVVFEVTEGFKGTGAGAMSVNFNLSNPEERRFSLGETVIVYLRGSARTGGTVGCTRTRRITPDDSEVRTLRELIRGTAGGAIEGSLRVFEGTRPPTLPVSTPLDHLAITAESVDRMDAVTVNTQTGGYFVFPWLEPGRYRIRLDAEKYAPVVRDTVIELRQRCQLLPPITVQLR